MADMNSKTPSLREAAQMAIDALDALVKHFGIVRLGNSTLADTTTRRHGHVAIAALGRALALPDEPVAEGYKLVPLEPTLAMMAAARWEDGEATARAVYAQMLDAAPQPAEPKAAPVDPLFGENDDR